MIEPVDYHSDSDYVSRSDLVLFARSPSKYLRHRKNGITEENDALRIGSGTHAIALKDAIGLDKIAQIPEKVLLRRKDGVLVKSGKLFTRWYMRRENKGKTLLLPKQWQLCQDVAESLGRVEVAETQDGKKIKISDLVARDDVLREHEYRWQDILPCRLKADLVLPLPGLTICLDLKTARSIDRRAFYREVLERKLWVQDAHYSEGLEAEFGNPVRFCFVVCEKTPDYDTAIFELDPSSRALAREGRRQLLEDLKRCTQSGIFVDPPKKMSIQKLILSAEEMGIEL